MTRTTPGVRTTVIFCCLLLSLFLSCENRSQEGGWTMAGRAGLNDEYYFLVCAHRLEDGSIHPSPILIYKQGTWPPISMRWQDGRWALVVSDTHAIEYRLPAVLLYEGPDRPLRELASSWENHYSESSAEIATYIETLLPKKDEENRREETKIEVP